MWERDGAVVTASSPTIHSCQDVKHATAQTDNDTLETKLNPMNLVTCISYVDIFNLFTSIPQSWILFTLHTIMQHYDLHDRHTCQVDCFIVFNSPDVQTRQQSVVEQCCWDVWEGESRDVATSTKRNDIGISTYKNMSSSHDLHNYYNSGNFTIIHGPHHYNRNK